METGAAFLAQSREYFTAHYLPKVRAALDGLSDEDLWWRPNPASNAIGNLILHLAGNIRQWVVSGVGGASDQRDRPAEFVAQAGLSREELLATLTGAVQEVDAVLARTNPAALHETRRIQGRDTTVMEAIYHVVEHFAMHTGQILYIAKLRSARDLGFYRLEAGIPRASWPGRPSGGSA